MSDDTKAARRLQALAQEAHDTLSCFTIFALQHPEEAEPACRLLDAIRKNVGHMTAAIELGVLAGGLED